MTLMDLARKSATVGGLLAAAGLAAWAAPSGRVAIAADDPYSMLPSSVQLTGVVRDFKERTVSGGHTDFELVPGGGYGHYMKMVQDALDSENKPEFRSRGYKVSTDWKDAQGRPRINPRSYISSKPGDVNGSMSSSLGNAAASADSMRSWYRDVPGVNVSRELSLSLVRQPGTNVYTFNDKTDSYYVSRGGFFPINGELFGNSGGTTPNQNFHFTFELSTQFVYDHGTGQVFTFTGDDDVWVYVDGKLVIDIGGVHGAKSQTIDLDRLNWLVDGQEYSLRFFFAERHRTQSNFRLDTTLQLRSVDPPTTTALHD